MTTLQSIHLFTASLGLREALNGCLFVLFMNLSVMVWHFMIVTWRDHRGRWTTWADAPGMQTACCLAWVFGIFAIRSGIVWLVLWAANRNKVLPWWFEPMGNICLIATGICLGIAALRSTHIFSPPEWGNQVWITSLFIALGFVVITLAM